MEISDTALKSCPFCDGMALLVYTPRGAAIWCSECERTLAESTYYGDYSKRKSDAAAAELVAIWNLD